MKKYIFIKILTLFLTNCLYAQIPTLTSSNLPIVVIDTHGQTIIDQTRIIADMGIIDYNGQRNYIDSLFNGYNGKIAIELRGSSSASYPKKQYRFETQDALGNNLNVPLLGLPSENDWIFYGPYDDQSLIRNVLAYQISNEMGRYASRTRFCEIVLNDEYKGLYVLMEKIKRDDNRVDISTLNTTDITGDELTGGYIIKIDKIEGEDVGTWRTTANTRYQYHYPKSDEIVQEQITYIQNYIEAFETVMSSPDFNNQEWGYPAYIDDSSFVDHFIINEVAKNVDAYRISAYLYKDKNSNDGKLHAGPVWDFNLSFGKAWFPDDLFLTEGWQVFYSQWRPSDGYKVPFWWERLVSSGFFKDRIISRWQELRQNILSMEHLFIVIDTLVDEIEEARIRNFQRWPETATEHSYEAEILQLKSWIVARTEWIDENLDSLLGIDFIDHTPERIELFQNYPNPFNPNTMIKFKVLKPSNVSLKIYSISGKEVRALVDFDAVFGEQIIKWDGKDNHGNRVGSGTYFCSLVVDKMKKTRKMLLIK